MSKLADRRVARGGADDAGTSGAARTVNRATSDLYVSHFFEFTDVVTGGIRESVANQRKMLEMAGVRYTESPRPDASVLHLNLAGPRSVFYARRAKRRDTPVVMHTHVTAEDLRDSFRFSNVLSQALRPYLAAAYGLADLLVCPSEYNRRVVESYAETETTVVTNGVDVERLAGFETLREEGLRRFDLSPPVVFTVGHVFERKGLATFVETARRLPDLDFVWFGPLQLSLKGRSTRRLVRGAPENCTFTGHVDDVRVAYAVGDVFFSPTREENEGMALLEAMSTGTPVVVRDIEPFRWLDHGVDCLKADGRFEFVLERLCDPRLRDRLGSNAVRRAADYSLSNVADRLPELYRQLV